MQDYNTFLLENFPGPAASVVNKTYPISAFAHTPLPIFYAMSTIVTDSAFKCPAYRGLANTAAKGIPVWTYLFNHTTTCDWTGAPTTEKYFKLLGSTHSAEVPYVFSLLDNYPFPNGSSRGNCSFDTFERQMSVDIVYAWTAMAEKGTPEGILGWPQFYTNTSQGVTFGASSVTVDVVDYSVCTEFWDVLNAEILKNVTGYTGYVEPSNSSSASNSSESGSDPEPYTGLANQRNGGSLMSILTLSIVVLCVV